MKNHKRFIALALALITMLTTVPFNAFAFYYGQHNCADYLTFVERVAPTCTDFGFVAHYLCNNCGNWYHDANATHMVSMNGTAIKPLDHNYSKEVIAPKCNAYGYTICTCTDCGHISKEDYVSPLSTCKNLTYVPKIEPTCTTTGTKAYYLCEEVHS